MTDRSGPLAGLRVLDMTQYVAGPVCTQLLADLGAEVVKIERPPGGDVYRRQGPEFLAGESITFLALNKGKKSLVIDAKHPEGRALIEQLIGTSDAFVHNFRPGTAERLGLGRDDVARISERVVWATVSGYGGAGPRGNDGGYDLIMQGESGLMAATGQPGGPPAKAGMAVIDLNAGVSLALGITAALLERERTGVAPPCESSLYETSISMGTILAERYLANGIVPQPMGSASPLFAPYQAYQSSDGYFTVEGTGPPRAWQRFCDAMEVPELADRPEFADNPGRVRNRELLREEVERRTVTRPTEHWLQRLRDHDLPCGSIRDVGEALESEQTRALGMVVEAEHTSIGSYRTLRSPLRHGPARAAVRGAPVLGEHTAEVLDGLGVDGQEIARLAAAGVIACAAPDRSADR